MHVVLTSSQMEAWGLTREATMWIAFASCVECSFMYRYISRESCSQFDSLPLTYFPDASSGAKSFSKCRRVGMQLPRSSSAV